MGTVRATRLAPLPLLNVAYGINLMSQSNGPVHKIYIGSVSCAIWAQSTGRGATMYNTTFARSYKDQSGQWKDSDSFGISDLGTISMLATLATAWITRTQAAERASRQQGGNGNAGNGNRQTAPMAQRGSTARGNTSGNTRGTQIESPDVGDPTADWLPDDPAY